MRAKEILAFFRVFGCFRSVHRNLADVFDVRFSPTVITADLPAAAFCGQRKTDGEPRRNVERPRVAGKDGVKIRTVAASRVARIINIAASPALSAFVVFDGCDHMIVNGARFFQIGFGISGGGDFLRSLFDFAVNRNQSVRQEPALYIRITILFCRVRFCVAQPVLNVFAAHGIEFDEDCEIFRLNVFQSDVQQFVAIIGCGNSMFVFGLDFEICNFLKRIIVRNRYPNIQLFGLRWGLLTVSL